MLQGLASIRRNEDGTKDENHHHGEDAKGR